MPNCGNNRNPLQHNGSSRAQRQLNALQQGYINVDEKKFADWIVFAKNFSRYLNYYDTSNAVSGNWSDFFSNDVCALLGDIAVQDVDGYKRRVKQKFDFLKDDNNKTKTELLKVTLNELFSAIASFTTALDVYYQLLPQGTPLKTLIKNVTAISLANALSKLISYYKAAVDLGFLPAVPKVNDDKWKVLGSIISDASQLQNKKLSDLWWNKTAAIQSWKDYYNAVTKDESIFGSHLLSGYERIMHAANHNLFASVFQQFLMAYSRLVTAAEKELMVSLEKQNDHAPHYALFLAFLKLFRTAQDSINTITQRHLDFYYKEVLQLKQKPVLPNSVHIITELAKTVDDYVMTKATALKAGKDSGGREVLYTTAAETVFNKAKVESLSAIYFGETINADNIGTINNNARLFAAPVINSADGMGAELTSANKEWHPFANKEYSEGRLTAVNMPKGEIGFAVASHYLYLQEGIRTIRLRFITNGVPLSLNNFSIYLTTSKKWHKVEGTAITINPFASLKNISDGTTSQCTELWFTLDGSVPSIVNYSAAVHGGTLNVNVPVLKLVLAHNDVVAYDYKGMSDISISKVQLEVEVGMNSGPANGVKNINAATASGTVDVSKPFQPFGPLPVKDALFIIGSNEVFTKKNAKANLNIEWAGISDFTSGKLAYPSGEPKTHLDFLESGVWTNANNDVAVFSGNASSVKVPSAQVAVPVAATANYGDEYNPYNAASINGFMRLVLKGGFGHSAYQMALSKYLIAQAKADASIVNVPEGTQHLMMLKGAGKSDLIKSMESLGYSYTVSDPNPDPGSPPYVPVIQSLSISYSACSDAMDTTNNDVNAFAGKQISFFHIAPFGDAEQHKVLNKQATQHLFPQFTHTENTGVKKHQAEFYIGLKNLQALQVVNILFQAMDGTANPAIDKPEKHVHWSCLGNNTWINFDKQQISDNTMQLIQPGIIQFVIPEGATTNNTLMPPGYLWLRASVQEKPDAVCKMMDVLAQAAIAVFADNNNAADFLNTSLPSSSISKLKIPQASVKNIKQPYASYGGRPAESSPAFYTRVSERLRHKARAVTIWDYEHLVLEAFPMIHKVKCLNHTKSRDSDYNEVVPGHVTIITVPDTRQRNDVDMLKPYTSQAILKAIEEFLKARISCHIQLHVVNPEFEQVRMKFSLKLSKGFDDFTLYSKKLQEEITAFLSPWAYGKGEISFGGKIYKSSLINFIEEREYVDYIEGAEMAHLHSDGMPINPDNEEITATTAKSMLVSVQASQHTITPA